MKFLGGLLALMITISSCDTSHSVINENFYPGIALSPSSSVITLSSSQVLSGNSITVTLTLKDTNGNPFVSTLPNVAFATSGGASTGTFGPVLNNGDGSYSSIFTGINAGSATMVSPIVNGASLTGNLPSITVLSGNFSLAQSTLSTSAASVNSGSAITVTLTAKDSSGNQNSSGGLTVAFSNSGGTSTGTFGATVDHQDGTYTALFTGGLGGSATFIRASIQGGAVTGSSPSVTVYDIAPSVLTYAANPAVYSKGTSISANTPSNSGGPVNSYAVAPALPSGLNLNPTTGAISGTPTVIQAAAAYTVTATNTGGSTTVSLSIAVTDIAPSTLSYANASEVYTKGSVISNNNPLNSGGSITGYTVAPALPSGLSLSLMTGVISGTPNGISATTSYTITGSNSGGSITASISITVIDVAPTNLSYTLNSPTYTKGNSIAANSPSSLGGAIVSYAVSPSLPTGLTLNTTSGVILGTPSALTAAAVYTVTATNSGGSITASLSITVQDTAPSSLTYATNPVTFTKGMAASDAPANTGGVATSFSVTPALPGGLTLNTSTGAISGVPTVFGGATAYTVTATNTGGSTTVSISITVNDAAPSGLSYSTSPAVYTKNAAITNNNPASSGGSIVSYAISAPLPAGLNFSTVTGIISGTPTAISGVTSYTITATNSGGSTTTALSITVNDIPPSTLTYASNPVNYTKGAAITANSTTNSGGIITSYSVSPPLPAGLSLDPSTGAVSGTPTTITGTATYTVTGVSSGGNVTASLIIAVNDVTPSALTYVSTSPSYTKNSSITADTVTSTGGPVTSYSVSPALPSGLSLDTSTGTISGTPTSVNASSAYTVTALNSGGSTTATLHITVNDIAPSALTYSVASPTFTKTLAITNDTPTQTGGAIISYAISPALPGGLSFSTSTGVISGTPSAVSASATYTVTATNSGGSITASLSITVNDVIASNLVYSADPVIYTKGSPISSNSPTSSGGSVTGYTVSPALPPGLSMSPSTGIITGTPTLVAAAANYTITASNSGGSVTDSISITVKDVIPSGLSYSANPVTYTNGIAISNNTPTISGGTIIAYSVSPSLPSGLNLNTTTGVISGTPSVIAATTSYVVTATNSGGSTTATLPITVGSENISVLSGGGQSATTGSAIAANLVAVVKDANANPVSGVSVTWAVTAGAGSVTACTTTTDASGLVHCGYTAGNTSGANTITATASGVTTPASFTVTGTAGTATTIAVSTGNSQTATAGSAVPLSLIAVVTDSHSNGVPSATVTWAVTVGNGSVSACTTSTDTYGFAQCTFTTGTTAGTNTVTATVSGVATPASFSETGTAGAASTISIVSGNAQSGIASQALASPFKVMVKDANNNGVSSATVDWTVASGGGSIATSTTTSDTSGNSVNTLTLGPSSGPNSATATLHGTAISVTFTATGSILTTVTAVYPTNGSNWNDYVKWTNKGTSYTVFNQPDTACAGTEHGYYGCIHGGEKKKVSVTGIASCAGLVGTDALGAFDWVCDATSGTAIFYSKGLKVGKGLRDLVTVTPSAAWLNNSFSASQNGTSLGSTASAAWWTNSVTIPTPNPGSSDPPVLLNTAGAVYVVGASTTTSGYDIYNTNKISIVTLGSAVLSYSGYSPAWCTIAGQITASGGTGTSVLCAGNSSFLWIEGNFSGSSRAIALRTPTPFARIHRTSAMASTYGLILASVSNYIDYSSFPTDTSAGILASGNYHTFNNVSIERSAAAIQVTGIGHTLINSSLSGNGVGVLMSGSTAGSLVSTTVMNASNVEVQFSSNSINNTALGNSIAQSAISGLTVSGSSSDNTGSNTFVNTVQSSASGTGIVVQYSSGNQFYDTAVTNNDAGATGISVGSYASPTFTNNNSFYGIFAVGGNSNSCAVGATTSGNLLTNGCYHGIGNTIAPIGSFSLVNSFVGPISVSDILNTTAQTNASASFASITDWANFQNIFRGWGIGGAGTFLSSTFRNSCQSGTCKIFDFRVLATDTNLLNRYGAFSTSNCPASVNASIAANVVTDTAGRIFLKSAVEIIDPVLNPNGNYNGLCEAGEACIYSPNLGSYQGEGDYTTQTCTFTGGNSVTGVTLYAYPTNGI